MDIEIRKLSPSDTEGFHQAVVESAQHISPWLPWCRADYTMAEAIEWTYSADEVWDAGTDYRFVIEDKVQHRILGSVGINQVIQQHKIGNLGYWVRHSALNKGVCTKASRLAVEYAFNVLGFQRIEIHLHPENKASDAVALKLGGKFEGVLRNKIIHQGQSVAAKCYSIIPRDYGLCAKLS